MGVAPLRVLIESTSTPGSAVDSGVMSVCRRYDPVKKASTTGNSRPIASRTLRCRSATTHSCSPVNSRFP